MIKRFLVISGLVLALAAFGCSSSSNSNSTTDNGVEQDVQEENGGGEDATVDSGKNNGKSDATEDTGNGGGKTDVAGDSTPTDNGSDVGSDVTPPKPIESCEQKDLPTEWDPAALIYSIQVVDEKNTKDLCADFNDDGNADNSLAGFAQTANNYLKDDGSLPKSAALMLEFKGVKDFTNTEQFTMNGLFGKFKDDKQEKAFDDKTNEMNVDPKSYGMIDDKCQPLISFDKAKIKDGKLDTGESLFDFAFDFQGLSLRLRLNKARLTGDIGSDSGDDGVTINNGVLTGYLLKKDLDAALAAAQKYCDDHPDASGCSYLTTAQQLLPTLIDLDLDGDGNADAAAFCLTFKAVKAKIVDYVPQQ